MKITHNVNTIYAYKDKSHNKIVYVGQTVNLRKRHYDHTKQDPYNKNLLEYEYPLSRGIRKYGIENYELLVLEENVPSEKMDEREIYWIQYYNTYYNGYNQTVGGKSPNKPIYKEQEVEKVYDLLKNTSLSILKISELTGISVTHIYNLNIGARRPKEEVDYPIRPQKIKGNKGCAFSQEENLEIHKLLKNSNLKTKEIAKKYGVVSTVISDINMGNTQMYRLDDWEYPIRKKAHLTEEQHVQLKEDLRNTEITVKELAKKYKCSTALIHAVNKGRVMKNDNYKYPLRTFRKPVSTILEKGVQ